MQMIHRAMGPLWEEFNTLVAEIEERGFSPERLDEMDKLSHTLKSLTCISGGSSRGRSNDGGSGGYSGYSASYDSNSYGGAYEGGSSGRRGRAANGRFISMDGGERSAREDMLGRLDRMIVEAGDEKTRQAIERCMHELGG